MGRAGRATILILVAVIALSAGCRYLDPYDDYRGVNLLTNRGLTAENFQVSSGTGLSATGYVEYYPLLTTAQFGSTGGLPSGDDTTIYRLEIPNLVPNGDFEETADNSLPVGWEEKSGAVFKATVGSDGDITGQSIGFEVDPSKQVVFNLDNLDSGFAANATYYFIVDFIRATGEIDMIFDYCNGDAVTNLNPPGAWFSERPHTTPTVETLPTPGVPNLDIVSTFTNIDDESDYFHVGSPSAGTYSVGVIDNLRIGRSDIAPQISIDLVDAVGDQLPLVAGEHTFSVYVKSEIDDQVTPSANGLNRFRAEQICLGVNHEMTVVRRNQGGWSETAWKRVSCLVELSEEDVAPGNTVTLRISVSHSGNETVGSLLIAEPFFELGDTR